MEARNRPLHDRFTRIRNCQVRLPRFQRKESWGYRQVEGLLQTVIRQLPAGSVLTLEVVQNEPFVSRTMVGAPTRGDKANEHLLDGQQRLTALWRSLHDDYDDRRFFVSLEPDAEIGGPYTITSVPRYTKDEKSYPLWLNDPARIWAEKLIPVNLLRPGNEAEDEAKTWAKVASQNNAEERISIIEHVNDLRNKFSNFNIPFLSLPSKTPPDIALDVFIKMNTSAAPLTPFDIIVAQAEAETGQSLHDLLAKLEVALPDLRRYCDPEDAVLAVGALIENSAPVRKTFLSSGFPKSLISNWSAIQRGLENAIQCMQDERIYDAKRLPTDVAFYVTSALWANAPTKLDKAGEVRHITRKYLWTAFFTDRYEKTASTRSLVDIRQLLDVLSGNRSLAEVELFDRSAYPLPSDDGLLTTGWPAKKERLSRAILVLTFQTGAFDFADGGQISSKNCDSREYHHLFPTALLEGKYSGSEINRALNCALISEPTNRTISSKDPRDYLGDRINGTKLGEKEVKKRLESHLIPFQEFFNSDYDAFVAARAKLIAKAMREHLESLN